MQLSDLESRIHATFHFFNCEKKESCEQMLRSQLAPNAQLSSMKILGGLSCSGSWGLPVSFSNLFHCHSCSGPCNQAWSVLLEDLYAGISCRNTGSCSSTEYCGNMPPSVEGKHTFIQLIERRNRICMMRRGKVIKAVVRHMSKENWEPQNPVDPIPWAARATWGTHRECWRVLSPRRCHWNPCRWQLFPRHFVFSSPQILVSQIHAVISQ